MIVQEQSHSLGEQFRGLVNPQVLLILLTGALGCASLFSMFTYITPMLVGITGFAEHNVTWILVLFGLGVTIGNILGGRLADWKLMPSLIVNFALLAVIISIFTFTLQSPVLAVINVFVWGIAAFGIMRVPWLSAVLAALALLGAWLSYLSTSSSRAKLSAGSTTSI